MRTPCELGAYLSLRIASVKLRAGRGLSSSPSLCSFHEADIQEQLPSCHMQGQNRQLASEPCYELWLHGLIDGPNSDVCLLSNLYVTLSPIIPLVMI